MSPISIPRIFAKKNTKPSASHAEAPISSSLVVSIEDSAPQYSTYSPDPASPPPSYSYAPTGVEEDLIATSDKLSQGEALVQLEKEARERWLAEEKRQKMLAYDRILSDNLRSFGL